MLEYKDRDSAWDPPSTTAIVALIVYALVAWLIVKLASLAFGETRSATATTTRSTTIGR